MIGNTKPFQRPPTLSPTDFTSVEKMIGYARERRNNKTSLYSHRRTRSSARNSASRNSAG